MRRNGSRRQKAIPKEERGCHVFLFPNVRSGLKAFIELGEDEIKLLMEEVLANVDALALNMNFMCLFPRQHCATLGTV